MKYILALFITFLVYSNICAQEQIISSRKIVRSESEYAFNIPADGLLKIDSYSGAVSARTWNKKTVSIQVIKYIYGLPESEAEAVLKKIKFEQKTSGMTALFSSAIDTETDLNAIKLEFNIRVPRQINIEIETKDGSIDLSSLDGDVKLFTTKGYVHCGNISGNLEIKNKYGNITVQNVNGNVNISSSGGNIEAGDIEGYFIGTTALGSVVVGKTKGFVQIESGGGNISISSSGKYISGNTQGGDIKIGFAGGPVDAETLAGSITVESARSSVKVKTGGGLIQLRNISGFIEAEAAGGEIFAEMTAAETNTDRHIKLICSEGDITVYIPANINGEISAKISVSSELLDDFEIISDFPLQRRNIDRNQTLTYPKSFLYGSASLNKGGNKIQLESTNGNIHIKKLK